MASFTGKRSNIEKGFYLFKDFKVCCRNITKIPEISYSARLTAMKRNYFIK